MKKSWVKVRGFSHVGIVVENLRKTLDELALTDASWAGVAPVWGEAFGCHIARNVVDGAEIEVIEDFLPRQLDDGEIAVAIDKAVSSTGASSIRDMGRVMGELKSRYTGQMDFGQVGPMVKDRLS